MYFYTIQCFLGFEWIYAIFSNFGSLFSDETRKTLRTGAVPTLNLPVKSHASKQRGLVFQYMVVFVLNHPIYLTHKRSVRFTRAFPLLSQVQELQLCAGLSKFDDGKIQDPVATYRLMRHSIPKIIDPLDNESSPAMQVTVYKRHNNCLVISDTDQCSECQIADAAESKWLYHVPHGKCKHLLRTKPLWIIHHMRGW